MKITDITTLLGKGYSVDQIKAVAEDEKKNSDVVQVALAAESYEKYNELLPVVADIVTADTVIETGKPGPKKDVENPDPKKEEEQPEYKKLYEEAKAKLEKFKQDQAKALARENIAGDPVDVDTVINSITDSIL